MNIYPHFRILHWKRPHQSWVLELSFDSERRLWSMPHGPVLHARERHLAIELSGAADAVSGIPDCWDAGPVEIRKWSPQHIVAVLHGAELRGCFSLVRFRQTAPARWLWVRVSPRSRHSPLISRPVVARVS